MVFFSHSLNSRSLMSLATCLHNFIEHHNILQQPTYQIGTFLRAHTTLYTIILVANHLFRAATMGAFMLLSPYSIAITAALSAASSLIYRLTVETHCAYKFAVPSYAGGIACYLLFHASTMLTHSLAVCASAAYFTYVVLTVHYDVHLARSNA